MPASQPALDHLSLPQISDILKNNETLFAKLFQSRCDQAINKLMKLGASPVTLEEALETAVALIMSCTNEIEDTNLSRAAQIIYKNFLMPGYLEDLVKEGKIVLPSK
jgi:hypothetical protein